MHFSIRNSCKIKKNILFGVTLPPEAKNDIFILTVIEKFKKQLNIITLLLTLLLITISFIKSFGYLIFFYLLWTDFAIILPYLPYIFANKKLKIYKLKMNFEITPTTILKENPIVENLNITQMPSIYFFPPFIISFIPIILNFYNDTINFWELFAYISLVFCLFILYVLFKINIKKSKENTQTNKYRNFLFIFLSYSTAIISILISIDFKNSIYQLSFIYFIAIIQILVSAYIEFKIIKIQESISVEDNNLVDEDNFWIWGLFYYNPKDKYTLKTDRININTTVNLATKMGKFLITLSFLIIISLPLISIPIIIEENAKIEIVIIYDTLKALHTGIEYEIPVDDIISVQLFDDLPTNIIRVYGTGMENLKKGKFKSREYGNINVLLDPMITPIIFIETNNKKYLLGTREANITEDIYNSLIQKTN